MLATLLSVLFLAAPAAPARSAQDFLKDVRATEEALERLKARATSIVEELESAEGELRTLEAEAARAEADARAAASQTAQALSDEDAARGVVMAQLDELAPRLRARYRLSRQGAMHILMSAHAVGELMARRRALQAVLEGDLALLRRARGMLGQLSNRRAALELARRGEARRLEFAQTTRAQARARKAELARLHEGVLAQKELRERTLDELRAQQEKLSALVGALEPDRRSSSFAAAKGRLPYPAKGFIEVGFGKVLNAKFQTVTFQKGLDLRAPEGTPVATVAKGRVVHAGPFRGYGNLVIVDHGDGYHSLYAHLKEMARPVGSEVERGDLLGQVGDTGSLKGAYLYFEIREKGASVDPRGWLGAP